MRAAPACQVSLRHFGVWRGAVLGLTALGVASIGAWGATLERPVEVVLFAAAAICALTTVALGASLARVPASDLRWDGRTWHLASPIGAPASGDVRVAIDLGPWMLLRFAPAMSGARTVWLPVQRRGLEAEWHALRCAVYSPVQPPNDDSPAGF